MYKIVKNLDKNEPFIVIRLEDNALIPNDPANCDYQEYLNYLYTENEPHYEDISDYQEYLKWVSEGNTPLPADE